MEEIEIETLEKLEFYFNKYKKGFLFRGQTKHYTQKTGETNIVTSFKRLGCEPLTMLKWSHYAKLILRAFTKLNYNEINNELTQAILQHYGWRSFFVDFSKYPHIACWFAANKYHEKPTLHMCENIDEDPIWLYHKEAQYHEIDQRGHIYIVSINDIKKLGSKIYDLTKFNCKNGILRFHAQGACLAGTVNGNLPHQAIVAHLIVDNKILKKFYSSKGIVNTKDVFPSRDKDFVLYSLLCIPWKCFSIDHNEIIPCFRRELEFPEYDTEFIKHMPSDIALYQGYWIADNLNQFVDNDNILKNIPFFKVPFYSYIVHHEMIDKYELNEIIFLLNIHQKFVIELNGLIKFFELDNRHTYEKGIIVEKVSEDVICISALLIDHPGNSIRGIGESLGWYYKITKAKWQRINNYSGECPCNNNLRHELQFSILKMLNMFLQNKKIQPISSHVLCHKELLLSNAYSY